MIFHQRNLLVALFTLVVALAVGVSITAVFLYRQELTLAASPDLRLQSFVIQKGETVNSIGERLRADGLIDSTFWFKVYYFFHKDESKKIQAGDYQLSASMTLFQITQNILKGKFDLKLTVLEGWRLEEIAQKIKDLGLLATAADFLNIASHKSISQIVADEEASINLEGYLFPDTYAIPMDIKALALINLMTVNWEKRIESLKPLFKNEGLSTKEAVILASIVEGEGKTPEDRKVIAGILLKRLKNDWPLQADATIQYAKDSLVCAKTPLACQYRNQGLVLDDLAIDSPYNTYKNPGLPIAAISAPSYASLVAVASPQVSSYWYYISDHSGKIHFAVTLDEQEQNMAKYIY